MTDNADNRSHTLLAPLVEKHPKMTVFVAAVYHFEQQLYAFIHFTLNKSFTCVL